MFVDMLVFVAVMLIGGVAQGVVMRFDLMPWLAHPLDGHRTCRGRRVFGEHKTIRGAIVMVVACTLGGLLLFPLHPPAEEPPFGSWAAVGAAMGLAYILAELPNSFVKRQLGIGPGDEATGTARRVQYLVDQTDSVVGVTLLVWWLFELRPAEVVVVLVEGVLAHVLFDMLLRRTHAK